MLTVFWDMKGLITINFIMQTRYAKFTLPIDGNTHTHTHTHTHTYIYIYIYCLKNKKFKDNIPFP